MEPSYQKSGAIKINFFLITFLFFLFNVQLYSQWSTDPANPLIVGYGINPEMCSDSAGGCYVTYESGNGLLTELNLRWFNRYGIQPWGWKKIIKGVHQQQETAQLLADGEGGVIICHEDRDLYGEARLSLQRVDTAGNFLWGPTGVVPSIADTMQSVQRLVSDGDGGCIILWMEHNQNGGIYRINRINKFGVRVWSHLGIYISTNYNYYAPSLIKSDDGYYYVYYSGALFKINHDGEIIRSDLASIGEAVTDGSGGLVKYLMSWQNPYFKLLAARIDSSGVNLWPSNVVVAESLYNNPYVRMIRNQNYIVFSWYGMKNGVNVNQFQLLRMDGSKVLSESLQLLNGAYYVNLMDSDSIRTYFLMRTSSLIAQSYDTLGNKVFNGNGVIVSTPTMGYVKNTTDGTGGFIVAGTFSNSSIVVQKVSRNGIIGEVVPVELTSFTAEILKNYVFLKWQTATETNNKGFEIERITSAGTKVIGFVPGRGTTTEITDYMYEDRDELNGSIKYRLKQIDLDGTYEYSNTVEVNIGTPADFILFQNYPNPFNSTTVIKFLIPRQEETRLSIFNILGQEIHTILNEKIEAGFYTYNYDASAQPSGVYFIRLKAGNFTSIRKIVLLK